MRIAQNTFPTATVISLQEAKDHLRVTSNAEDSTISGCIKSATSFIEQYTGINLQSSTFTAYLDEGELNSFVNVELWRYPITAITSVQYIDSAGDTQTYSSTNYSTDLTDSPARILFTSIPTVKSNILNAFRINFTCGFTSVDSIPKELIGWVKILTGFFYETRQSEYTASAGNVTNEIEYNYQRALDKFRKDSLI